MLQFFPHKIFHSIFKKELGYNKIVAILKILRLKNAECGSIISDAATPMERSMWVPLMGNPGGSPSPGFKTEIIQVVQISVNDMQHGEAI